MNTINSQPTYLVLIGCLISSTFNAITYAADSELTATIIGSGSPLYNENRASAGVLITQGDTDILIDMGPGVRENLYRSGINTNKFDALMFTHHHVDHNAEFISLLTQSIMGPNSFSIYGPKDTVKFTDTLLDLYHEDLNYRLGKRGQTLEQRTEEITVKDLKSGESFNINEIKVTVLEVPHTIETLAYRFDYQEQTIVITGDLTYTDKLPPFAQGADCMIIDSGGMKMMSGTEKVRAKMKNGKTGNDKKTANNARKEKQKGGNKPAQRAHLGLEDSSLLAKQSNVKNLVYTHFVPGTVDEKASLAIIEQNYKGTVTFGADLMTLNCGNH